MGLKLSFSAQVIRSMVSVRIGRCEEGAQEMGQSRRQFLKNTGALIVSFNLFPTAAKVFAQSAPTSAGDLDPQSLDSWIAIAQDGTVTIFTSKVELGTG